MKTKVLFVTHKFPPAVGGMEVQCHELFEGIKESYEIVMLKFSEQGSRLFWLLTLKSRIKKALLANPDITHVYFNDGLVMLAASAVKSYSDAKVLVTLHGLDLVFPHPLYQNAVISCLNKYVDAVVCVSEATADECRVRNIAEDKIHVVSNGVDLTLEKEPQDHDYIARLEKRLGFSLQEKKIVVSMGRSVRRKGFSWFLEKVLPQLDDDLIYLMIGPRQKNLGLLSLLFKLVPKRLSSQIELMGFGMDQVRIEDLLKQPFYKQKAIHLGKVSFQDKLQLLKHSHAFLMPNIKVPGDAEGFGLVALEAVMSGTAVMVSSIEGITEAIKDGENGIYVNSEDAEDWVKKIGLLLSNEKKRRALVKKGIGYTKRHYSWDKMVEGYRQIFDTV